MRLSNSARRSLEAAGGALALQSLQSLIEGGEDALEAARKLVERAELAHTLATTDVRILAPLPRPVQIRDFLCFPDHLRGAQRVAGERAIDAAPDPCAKRVQLERSGFFELSPAYFDFPLYYICNRMSVVGPDAAVDWPSFSSFIDFELEWAAIVGRQGRKISRLDAGRHIFGYTIFNDWSARDEQGRVINGAVNLGPSSAKDFANSLGPCIVTADEIDDPYALEMTARLNGVEVSRGSTRTMHYRFEDLLEHISRAHDIYPGEVFGSGTVGGGCAIEAGVSLKHLDVVELEVEKIGVLRNRVIAPHLVGAPERQDALAEIARAIER